MRKMWILTWMFCLACKTALIAPETENNVVEAHLQSECPDDGNCRVTLHRNRSMELKRDGTGYLYYVLVEKPGFSVIHFEYIRKTDPELQDAGYREEILFEIPANPEKISLLDADLAQVKMLFGRHCFCRGQAGYFLVQEGELALVSHKNEVRFDLDFKCPKVPQTIKRVSAILK